MPGPGDFDPSDHGIFRIEDLPKPKIRCQCRNYRAVPVHAAAITLSRSLVRRTLQSGNPLTGRPRDMILIYALRGEMRRFHESLPYNSPSSGGRLDCSTRTGRSF